MRRLPVPHRKGFERSSTALVTQTVCHKVHHHRRQMSTTNTISNTSISNTSTKTKSHYETHSAASYDSAFFYEVGPYMKHLRDLCDQRLQLHVRNWNRTPTTITGTVADTTTTTSTIDSSDTQTRIVLDIGGGTGTFTRTLIANDDDDTNSRTNIEAIVMDPYLEFNSTVHDTPSQNNLSFIKAPAEAFIVQSTTEKESTSTIVLAASSPPQESFSDILPHQYHQVLMKEVIHHFATIDRPAIFHGLYHHGLIPTNVTSTDTNTTTTTTAAAPIIPSILIITRPQYDIDYPLWEEARTVWAQNQPSLDVLIQELETVGFVHVTHTIESYPCSIPLSRWTSMIRNRFWSTFTDRRAHV